MLQKQEQQVTSLVKKGYKLIPLKRNGKEPILKNWNQLATSDLNQIFLWAETYPDCNFGILTGFNLVVLDVDNKNGKIGSSILESFRGLPDTYTVETPNGGYHYYYKCYDNIKSRNYGNGLEIKSLGNQVVAAGSTIDGKCYEIINDCELAEFPAWLYEELENSRKKSKHLVNLIPYIQSENSTEHLSTLANILDSINPDLDYESWLRVLYASMNVFGCNGDSIAILKSWSSEGSKFDEREFWKKVKSYDPSHVEKVGYPTLLELQWSYPKQCQQIAPNSFGSQLHKALTDKVIDLLKQHGNQPSTQHHDALNAITYAMSHGINNTDKFRLAFPLETGMGKTTCVVALACLLEPLNKSLLICAEQIEQLAEVRDSMIKAGVKESNIGIYHKLSGVEIPSIKLEEMHQYQFLLVSHSRVNNDSKYSMSERLLTYKNEKRNLTIWDESLITTDSYYCALSEMKRAINDWTTGYEIKLEEGRLSKKHPQEYEAMYKYLIQVKELLSGNAQDSIINLPNVSLDVLNRNLIKTIVNSQQYRTALETLIKFNQLGSVRVVKGKDGFSVMQFEQKIDECFDKIIVMDASSRIRKLISFDKSVQVQSLGVSKTFQNVQIHHADVRSSKSSFEESKTHLKNYLKEFSYLLESVIPSYEPLIILTHKDTKEEIRLWAQETYPLKEIYVLNWGQHKATNKYKHVKYVFTCGILYRDWKEISASVIAQTGNLNYFLIDSDVSETYYSEQAEMLYQGFSRGNSRNTVDGKAGEQTIYMFHPVEDYNKIMPYLRKVMPRMVEVKYQTKHLLQGRKNAKDYMEIASAIRDYLISVEQDIVGFTKTQLREKFAPHLNSNDKTWRNAITKVQSELSGWIFNRKTILRCN